MNVSDFPGLQRRPDTQEIDVQGSLRLFAEGVITLKAEEARIRSSRRYKAAVLKTFDEGLGFKLDHAYDGRMFFHLMPLVFAVVEKLRHKKEENVLLWDEVQRHIMLNSKRYLLVNKDGQSIHVLLNGQRVK